MKENRHGRKAERSPLKGVYDNLSDELKEKAKACKTMDELAVLAAKEGVELPDEALDAVAGGDEEENRWFICGGDGNHAADCLRYAC